MADDTGSASPPSGTGASSGRSAPGGNFLALRSGLSIRQYVIEEVIGAGGFGITYRARHERLSSKIFALKEYFPRRFAARQGTHVISTPDGDGLFRWGLDRFLQEADALAKCEHPGIVDVVDYFEENGTAYAVLGYVEGQQFGQWLDSLGRPPTQAELDRILMLLLDALETVHGAKLLHRDIAPDNIMIRRDGSPCLIDFGACREDIRDRSRKLSAIVKHGYSPPEQYHGAAELQGPWTDIYAVAATIYRAISGQPPMDSSRRGALGDGLAPISKMATTDYRPGFLAAIDAALSLKPEHRPQSIAEWRSMLFSDVPTTGLASSEQRPPQAAEASPSTQHEATQSTISGAEASGGSTGGAIAPGAVRFAEAPLPPSIRGSARRGRLVAGLAVVALLAAGMAAWWRGSEPSSDAPVASSRPAGARPSTSTTIDEKAKSDQAKTADQANVPRAQSLNNAWRTCREAAEAARATACASVIQSDDTAARRAAALHLVGMAARNAGNYDKAIADFTQSLALVANDAQVLNDRGIAHFLRGGADGLQAAMRDYNSAIQADGHHAEALNNRAWSLFREERFADALADANRSIEAVPTNGYAYDTRAQIHEALGQKDDAIRDFERALNIDPSQETSRSGLARLRGTGR